MSQKRLHLQGQAQANEKDDAPTVCEYFEEAYSIVIERKLLFEKLIVI